MNATPLQRAHLVKRLAAQHNFDRCGIAPLGPIAHGDYYLDWLRQGRAGTMGYLHRRQETRLNPAFLLSGAKSAIVLAANYYQPVPAAADTVRPLGTGHRAPGTSASHPQSPETLNVGLIARYAWGEDYHLVLPARCEALLTSFRAAIPDSFDAKICVDTAAIIERELASAAGIGWIGKNTLVLHQDLGSYFFLAVILTTLDLMPDAPAVDHCGTCTRCLEACPTEAFTAPHQMDATKCISYLTIEHRGDIPPDLQPKLHGWLFGCDICQQVCPYNREPPATTEPRFTARPPAPAIPLAEVAAWIETDYAAATKERALDRATFPMWKRTAAVLSVIQE